MPRSALILGSISRFGKAETSQCETEEPLISGFGVYNSGRPAASAPAVRAGSLDQETVTEPGLLREPYGTAAATAALSASPSACKMPADGMVMVASAPP